MYPIQNVNNDPTGNLGYHKLIIEKGGPQQNVELVQNQPNNNYPINQQQPNYLPQNQQPQPPPYQQPLQQPYQQTIQQPYFQFQQPFQPQQPIFNPQFNQVAPNIEQLNSYNNIKNQGQNKRFGIGITIIWAITSFLDLIVAIIGMGFPIPQEFLITLTALIINDKQTTAASVLLFQIFILSNLVASLGFYQLLGSQAYVLYLIFISYQLITIISASVYLISTLSIPEARHIFGITTIWILISSSYYIFYKFNIGQTKEILPYLTIHIIIWFLCCSIQSHIFVKILNQVYAGQNKRISRENIWTGFILFKLHFYVPGL